MKDRSTWFHYLMLTMFLPGFVWQSAAMTLRERVAYAIAQVDEKLNLEDMADMEDCDKHNIQKLYRETLHQCYNFGFEVSRCRLQPSQSRVNLGVVLKRFSSNASHQHFL